MDILEKMQSRFNREVEHRCELKTGSVKLPPVKERLLNADLQQLRKIMKNEEMFDMILADDHIPKGFKPEDENGSESQSSG